MDENHEGKDPENEVPQKHPIKGRPEWLWENNVRSDGSLMDIRIYIEQLEAENRNLRESCEILKALDAQKGQIIIDLGGEVP